MISVVYVSSAVERFAQDELDEILEASRRNNRRDGITGMLLYADGNFMQAVEGPEEAIERLFARLELDPRHRDVIVIGRFPITEREFGQWAMGFRRLRPDEAMAAGDAIADLRKPIADLSQSRSESIARRLLERFREGNLV